MTPTLIITVYCLLIVIVSLTGGWLPTRFRLTHTSMQLVISFVGGLMLGIGLFHLLPHAVHPPEMPLDRAIWWMMIGLLAMFFLLRMFHFHHHCPAEDHVGTGDCQELHGHAHDHDHAGHAHGESQYTEQPANAHNMAAGTVHGAHDHSHAHAHEHHLSWLGVAIGLAVHTAIDGIALAASVVAEAQHREAVLLFGLGTFLAVALHKPLDAMSITSLMAAGGWSKRSQLLINGLYALMCPLGALLFYFGVTGAGGEQAVIVGAALSFSAGVFVCISLGDLLPELSFHSHDRIKLSLALVLGVALAYGIGYLEPEHAHHHGSEVRTPQN